MRTHTDLLNQISQQLAADQLKFPGLPDIALQVQNAVSDPQMTLPKLAQIISKDPALSLRLVRIANSAWLGRPVRAENLPQAVMRLGFWQIRNVALGMALEGLYESQDPLVKDELRCNWLQSMELTAAAVTLLNHYQGEADLHGYTLALACTCSRIGILPLLSVAEENGFPDKHDFNAAKQALAVPLGVEVLSSWQFNNEIIDLHKSWREGIGAMQPSYLSFMQLAGIVTGQIQVNDPKELLKMYADAGCIIRPGVWQQPAVQADYQNILSALRD